MGKKKLPDAPPPATKEEQREWAKRIDESAYTVASFCRKFGINQGLAYSWLNFNSIARSKSAVKMRDCLAKIAGDKAIPFDPSFGYATREQVDKINSLGLGHERDKLMSEIDMQNRLKGKWLAAA